MHDSLVASKPGVIPARELWARALSEWAIPAEILEQAQESPWIHPPQLFEVPENIEATISHTRALDAVPPFGSVLDVGCGGGVAAFALTPPAIHVMGVDEQREMLQMFAGNARARGVSYEVFKGLWPAISVTVPSADVVVSHHVVYNVSQIEPFLKELDLHARKRVVIEMPVHHPLTNMTKAWKHFWNLDRPTSPTAEGLLHVLEEMGINAQHEYWSGQLREGRDKERDSEYMRIRLCLPLARLSEVRDFLDSNPLPDHRDLATIWWDSSADS